ncbi:hypothetical protein ACLM5J_15490 [Nocardioides sp. Bht2]|uniref:hypothetical protein n=1 Tax=Nocardioides sp. Bht2 TaxID=3392297 RepID=UPI0039B64C2C
MKSESIVESLRPAPEALDPAWSVDTLEAILAAPDPTAPRRRRARVLAGLAGVAVLGLGGAAWAAGLLPGGNEAPESVRKEVSKWGGDADGLRTVADVTLTDGTGFVIWQAEGDRSCMAISHTRPGTPRNQMWNGSTGCGTGDLSADSAGRVWVVREGAAAPGEPGWRTAPWYPVAYGVTKTGATEVRMHGTLAWTEDRIDLTIPVDPKTGGFAAALDGVSWPAGNYPETTTKALSGLTFDYLDADGTVLATACDC